MPFFLVLLFVCFSNAFAKGALETLLHGVVNAHSQSHNFHAWQEHEKHPTHLISSILKMPEAEVCEAFSSITNDDFNIFYVTLEENKSNLPNCLKSRLETLNQEIEVGAFYTSLFSAKSNKEFRALNANTKAVLLDNRHGNYYSKANLPAKHIALTFDDGPHSSLTPALLKILRSWSVKATFFMLGQNAVKNSNIVKDIYFDGHTLANHTHSHKNLKKTSYSKGVAEIEKGFGEISAATGSMAPFFRFPYGNHTSALRNYLKANNIAEFFWSVDTLDWKYKNSKSLLQYALNQTRKVNRGIILFHDIQPQTVQMMPEYLRQLTQEGYTFVLMYAGESINSGVYRD